MAEELNYDERFRNTSDGETQIHRTNASKKPRKNTNFTRQGTRVGQGGYGLNEMGPI
jgi:hypothetical protein